MPSPRNILREAGCAARFGADWARKRSSAHLETARGALAVDIDPKKVGAAAITAAIVVTFALPAYAQAAAVHGRVDAYAPVIIEQDAGPAQTVEVPAAAATITVARDVYGVKTGVQILAEAAAARQEAIDNAYLERLVALKAMVRAPEDDYPWPYEKLDQEGGGLSPLGYYYRECVDFVAWRLNRDAGGTTPSIKFAWSNLTPLGGDARDWLKNWEAHKWTVTKDKPEPGFVAWWSSNHVAYVRAVNADGTVSIEEYNIGNKGLYSARTIPITAVELFLAPPGK